MRWIWLIAVIGCGRTDAVRQGDLEIAIAGIGKPCASDADCVALLSCVPIDGGKVNGSYVCELRADPCPEGTTARSVGLGYPICAVTCWEMCVNGCTPQTPFCNYSQYCLVGAAPDAGLVMGACH